MLDKLYTKYLINKDLKDNNTSIQKDQETNNINVMNNINDKYNKIIRQNSSINCVIKCLFSFQKFVFYLKKKKTNLSQDSNKKISNSILYALEN